jgi:protein-disulfide isomerase
VEIKPTDMVHGKATAPVTMIEYASMTCPHCARFQKDVIPSSTRTMSIRQGEGRVSANIRSMAPPGWPRRGALLSGDQYFSFIDLLFANQMNWIKDFDNNGS